MQILKGTLACSGYLREYGFKVDWEHDFRWDMLDFQGFHLKDIHLKEKYIELKILGMLFLLKRLSEMGFGEKENIHTEIRES